MNTLKQFQEEGDNKFDEIFGKDGPERNCDSIGRIAGCDDCYSSIKLRAEHKAFNNQQTTLAYELGKKEMLEMVVKEIDGMKYNNEEPSGCDCGGNTKGIYDEALDSLKQKLLALNEE